MSDASTGLWRRALRGIGWRGWLAAGGAGLAFGLGCTLYIAAGLWQRYPDQRLEAFVTVASRWTVLMVVLAGFAALGAAVLREVERERALRPRDHLLFVLGVAAGAALVGETLALAALQQVHLASGFRGRPFWEGQRWPAILLPAWELSLPMLVVVPAFWTLARVWSDRARSAARVLSGAQLRLAEAQRRVLGAELRGAQAMVEPGFLFGTLGAIEQRFESDPPRAARLLDALIRYLRAAMPANDDAATTLAQQGELVRAWLDIEGLRSLDALRAEVDVPASLAGRPFAPLLLVPLVAQVVQLGLGPGREGVVEVHAAAHAGRLVVQVQADAAHPTAGAGVPGGDETRLAEVRARLAALYGAQARLVLEAAAGRAQGRIEIDDPQGRDA